RQGREEGLAEAARAREEEERASAGSLAQRVEAIVTDFDQSLAALEESLANRMLGLSLQMAAQVVRTHVDTRPDAVLPPLREAIVADFDQSLAALEESLANRMLGLSLQMAAQVVRTHVDTRPDAVLPPLREAIADVLAEARRIVLRIAPADEAVVREALGELVANGRCDLRVDMSVRPGGCLVDSPMAAIDATLETRWRHVLAAIGEGAPEQLGDAPEFRIDD